MRLPRLLTPLAARDYALWWVGSSISLLGDGIYLVALAWQVYDLSSSATALSLVGLAWSVGLVAFLLVGGRIADRIDRRRVMIAADLVRGACVAAMGVLSVTGSAEVWMFVVLGFCFGAGEGFFSPASTALLPALVPAERLPQANALQEVTRPLMVRLLGPAVGGGLVAWVGGGTAFLVDGASFLVAVVCVWAIRVRPERAAAAAADDARAGSVREALAWGRTQPWFWATLLAVALSIMTTLGPVEVLLPLVVRRDLGLGAGAYGTVLALGGLGGVVGGVAMGQRGLPLRKVRFMLLSWALGSLAIAGYGLGAATWQLALLAFLQSLGISCGMVVWGTLMQTRTPRAMLGRASSLDWLVSLGLAPLSFALTGPAAALIGHDPALVGAGLLGALTIAAIYLAVPGLRADDDAAARAPATSASSRSELAS